MTNENKRLETLYSYEILDTDPEVEFDNITFLASTLCNTPISTITLIDKYRQWYKSKIGIEVNETSRETSFCALAIEKSSDTIVIEKLMEDEDFRKVGLMNGLTDSGFYAGVPIKDAATGQILGTLCVIDYKNNTLTAGQIRSLEILATQTSKLFELRKSFKSLTKSNEYLYLRYSELEKFAGVISHDMKSPLNNIISLIGLIKDNTECALRNQNLEYLNLIEECSQQLKKYVDGVLNYYKLDSVDLSKKEEIIIPEFIEEVKSLFSVNANVSLFYSSEYPIIEVNKYALLQILTNLVGNGIKYNDKEEIVIKVDFTQTQKNYIINVSDNGIGMKSEYFNEIYEAFKNLNIKDNSGNYGTGMGLSSVKKIIDRLEGTIDITSELKTGSTFKITLKK